MSVWICLLTRLAHKNAHTGNRSDCRSYEVEDWGGAQEAAAVIQAGQEGLNWAGQGAPWLESVQWPDGYNLWIILRPTLDGLPC